MPARSGEQTLEAAVQQAMAPGGPLARAVAGYQARPQQLQAARAIARILAEGGALLLEAPTGSGKSLAALVPLALHLDGKSPGRAYYSTATITLQEQLTRKDIPAVQRALGRPDAAVLKGMGRYVCLLKWAMHRDRLGLLRSNQDAARFDAWVRSTRTGDQAELLEPPPWWAEVAADHADCLGPACSAAQACFALQARERARNAQLAVCNHHILLAYARYRPSAFSADAPIVIDEAHRLADIATEMLGSSITTGTLPGILQRVHGLAPRPEDPIHAQARILLSLHEQFARALTLQPARDAQPVPREAARAAAALANGLQSLLDAIRFRPWDVFRDRSGTSPNDRALMCIRLLENYLGALAVIAAPPSGVATWAEPRQSSVALHTAPVEPAQLLAQKLFTGGPRILMSATLSASGDFAHVRRQLGIRHAAELVLPPVFDYARQMRYYFPHPPLDPNAPDFTPSVIRELAGLLRATRGRALVLFTSYAQLREVAEGLRGRLPYTLIVQDELSSAAVVEAFRADLHSVMLATNRMWEGVDVPGPSLSVLVVVRLPFEVPTHPLARARYEAARSRGENPFSTVVLPEAITKMRQGIGRLIRSPTDRGVAAILDGRVLTRSYGRRFLTALPQAPAVRSWEEAARFIDSTQID